MAFGARIVQVRGAFDAALAVVRELGAGGEITLVNSVNPHRIEGQKTAAFEICETLGDAPEALFIPVGNAGNITAYWRGFVEAATNGMARTKPKMFGFQAEGAAPIVRGRKVEDPQTFATAIRIGDPASWKSAVAARDESGGAIETVSDAEIAIAYRDVARREGIFCEPASAASLAGLRKRARETKGLRRVVCVLTGNGLKDQENVGFSAQKIEVDATAAAVRDALALA
jgi:threonine synthase